ncbi:hypothetical protein BDF19DRAFT_414067 [Syncephalis fuscata]|nr:hypothetical protein BDF19DRAFT_414067 [Syncephalis fuscata]
MVDVNGATITVSPHSLPRSEPISPLPTPSLKCMMDSNSTGPSESVDIPPSNEPQSRTNNNSNNAPPTMTTTSNSSSIAANRPSTAGLNHVNGSQEAPLTSVNLAMLAVSGLDHDLSEPISSPLTSLDSDEELDDWEPAWKLYPYNSNNSTVNGHTEKENTVVKAEPPKPLPSKSTKNLKTKPRQSIATNGSRKRVAVSTRGETNRESAVNTTEEEDGDEGDDEEGDETNSVADPAEELFSRTDTQTMSNGYTNGVGRRSTGKRGRAKGGRSTRASKQQSTGSLLEAAFNSSANSNNTTTTATASNATTLKTRSAPGTPSARATRRSWSESIDVGRSNPGASHSNDEAEDVEQEGEMLEGAQQAISDMNRLEQAFCLLRKRVYHEKLTRLQQEEELIREGNHPSFLDQLPSVEEKHVCNMRTVEAKRRHLVSNALNMFEARKRQAECHFETQKWALRRSITERLHACRVQLAEERFKSLEPLPGPIYDARSSAGP